MNDPLGELVGGPLDGTVMIVQGGLTHPQSTLVVPEGRYGSLGEFVKYRHYYDLIRVLPASGKPWRYRYQHSVEF